VRDLALQARLDEILAALEADDTLAWELTPNGTWRPPAAAGSVNAQTRLAESAIARARRIAAV